MMKETVKKIIEESVLVKKSMLSDEKLLRTIKEATEKIVHCYRNGGKVLFCGNGGSAADAQHLAAELSGRFYMERESLAAEALHVNSSYVTAVANDYSYDEIYARYIRGVAKKGDVLVSISTSGNSENIVRAVKTASNLGMVTISLTGENGGKLREISDYLINIKSKNIPRIQEAHILAGHIICELVERRLFE